MQISPNKSTAVSEEFDWQDYEHLVKDISDALGREYGVTVECWGRKCVIEGPPGIRNQVDVLTSHSDGLQRYRTAISCKWRKEKVSIPHVREIALIVHDANLSKGVIVSRNGFTKPAKQLAEAKNIGLIELRKPTDEDWGDSLTEIHIDFEMDMGWELSDIRFRRSVPVLSPDDDRSVEALSIPDPTMIVSPGQDRKTLVELAAEACQRSPDQEQFEIHFPEGTVVSTPSSPGHPGDGIGIAAVSFRLQRIAPLRSEMEFRAEDHIYMIMRDLFENRHYNITTDGEIVEAL